MKGLLIAGAIVGVLLLYGVGKNNQIVSYDQAADQKLADVNSAMQRRFDLIPNLARVVAKYAEHEKSTLTEVTNARAKIGQINISPEMLSDPTAMKRFEALKGELSSAFSHLMAVSEAYPNLKANENFLSLQSQLEGSENRINIARQDYNSAVRDYNTVISQFPGSVVAGFRGSQKKSFFELTNPNAANAPQVF